MSIYDAPPFIPGPGDGIPGEFTLSGSGFAVPAGIDAVLEYNGLFLNVQKNIDRYKINTIDGLYDADVRDTRDVNSDDDGETPYNTLYGGRTIVLNGIIQTYSIPKLRDMQEALRAAFVDISTELPLYFRTGNLAKDHFINCKKISPISGIEQQANRMISRDFQISLRASNPRFLAAKASFFEESFESPVTTPIKIADIWNRGNYKAVPIFRIYGPSHRSKFFNDRTGKRFAIRFIDDGDFVEYDMAKKTLVNRLGQNQWNWLSDNSDTITFLRGNNPIFYTGDCKKVQIMWRDSWI